MDRDEFIRGWRAKVFEVDPVDLPDGTTGWHMRRSDDCLQAAIATVLQVPMDEVPDLRLNARTKDGLDAITVSSLATADLARWCEKRKMTMASHSDPPWRHPRWIGVVPPPPGPVLSPFSSHCLVMHEANILHDPLRISDWGISHGVKAMRWQQTDIQYGYTFNERI